MDAPWVLGEVQARPGARVKVRAPSADEPLMQHLKDVRRVVREHPEQGERPVQATADAQRLLVRAETAFRELVGEQVRLCLLLGWTSCPFYT